MLKILFFKILIQWYAGSNRYICEQVLVHLDIRQCKHWPLQKTQSQLEHMIRPHPGPMPDLQNLHNRIRGNRFRKCTSYSQWSLDHKDHYILGWQEPVLELRVIHPDTFRLWDNNKNIKSFFQISYFITDISDKTCSDFCNKMSRKQSFFLHYLSIIFVIFYDFSKFNLCSTLKNVKKISKKKFKATSKAQFLKTQTIDKIISNKYWWYASNLANFSHHHWPFPNQSQ